MKADRRSHPPREDDRRSHHSLSNEANSLPTQMLQDMSPSTFFLLSLLMNLAFSPQLLLLQAEVVKVGSIQPGKTCFQSTSSLRHRHNPVLTSSTVSKRHVKKKALSSLAMTPMQSLKPAAVPLLEGGKALARYGELIIDASTTTTSYLGFSWKGFQMGGNEDGGDIVTRQLSPYIAAMGACIRTAGDSIAQVGALMRFKTGHELVVVELRDASFGFCHQLEEDSNSRLGFAQDENRINASAQIGVTSAWGKAEEALSEINSMLTDVKNDAIEWDRAKSIMVTTISIHRNIGKHLELISVRIVENASANEIGRILMDLSKEVEALSHIPPILNKDRTDIWNESTQTLGKAANSIKEAGIILGAKLDDEADKNKGKNKSWMKNGA